MKQLTFLLTLLSTSLFAQKIDVDKQIALAGQQYQLMLAARPDTSTTIHSAKQDGSYSNKPSSWWCSGFFPGGLWFLYEKTKDLKWESAARLWAAWRLSRAQPAIASRVATQASTLP
jgi:hypothetical protein